MTGQGEVENRDCRDLLTLVHAMGTDLNTDPQRPERVDGAGDGGAFRDVSESSGLFCSFEFVFTVYTRAHCVLGHASMRARAPVRRGLRPKSDLCGLDRASLRAPRRSITINIVPAPITSSHRELITVRNCAVYTDEMNRSGESNDKVDAHIIEGCASDGGGCIGGDVKASEP